MANSFRSRNAPAASYAGPGPRLHDQDRVGFEDTKERIRFFSRMAGQESADYQPPFPLTAKPNELTLMIDRPKLTPTDEKLLMQEGQRNKWASE